MRTHSWATMALAFFLAIGASFPVSAEAAFISVSHVESKPVGHSTSAWGTVQGTSSSVPVWTEAYVGGQWLVSQRRTTNNAGGYSIPLTYGMNEAGTHRFRIGASTADGTSYSREFVMVRTQTYSISVSHVSTKPVGQSTSAWGTVRGVGGGATVWTEANVNGTWLTSQRRSTTSTGGYSIPLTYGVHEPGTYRYRIAASTPAGTIRSVEFQIVRTSVISQAQRDAALRDARDYMRALPFSRQGLIDQLIWEGHSSAASELAADNVGANWYAEAMKMANSYLQVLPFSREGLIQQLVQEEGFLHGEAVFGVDHVKVNWYAQAMRTANDYLDVMPFSRQDLIQQLVYFDGFTHGQAVFGVDNINANWYAQAGRSAANWYSLGYSTRTELIDVLMDFELYTYDEAMYGASTVGL